MHKKLLVSIWGISIVVIGLLALAFRGESAHFFGITDDREQTILFESPVDIVQIRVVEGEQVRQGQLLMEVQRDSLSSGLVILDEQLTELMTRDRESVATARAQLASLRSQQEAQQANLDSKIQSLQSRYDLNQSFLIQLDGHAPDLDSSNSPILAEIEGLTRERQHLRASLESKISNLEAQLNAKLRPVDAQVAELEERKSALQHQATKLTIRADFDGRVGSLLFRTGEIVAPFQPILTVHGSSPEYVNGYIHETVINRVKLGQQVWVQSTTSGEDTPFIESTVESLGTRIVEYPARLKKNPLVQAWGREVVVRFSGSHPLLLGEKVIVLLDKPDSTLTQIVSSVNVLGNVMNVFAGTPVEGSPPLPPRMEPSFIFSHVPHIDPKRIEASGVLWDPESLSFLLISDESLDGQPALYRMDQQGRITNQVKMQGGPKIDDLESISTDGPYLYLLASLSMNKKGTLKSKRRQFSRLERVGPNITYRDSIDLFHVLEQAATNTHHPPTAQFLQDALQSKRIDIEGHMVRNGDLFLGFKAPWNGQGQTVILKIRDLNNLFSGHMPQAKIWGTVTLVDSKTGDPARLSDMLWIDNTLLLIGARNDTQTSVSYVWAYDHTNSALHELAVIPNMKAEGISPTQHKHEFMLVADGGGKTASRYITMNFENLSPVGSL